MTPVRHAVAVATATAAWDLDDDAPLLVSALDDLGVSAAPTIWDDAGVAWSEFDLVVVRSTWDYTDRLGDFLAWAERVGHDATLANPASVLRWNTDKRYLRALDAAGIPVVSSDFFDPGDPVPFGPTRLPDCEYVVKPTVSAGSRDTARYSPDRHDEALEHIRLLLDAGRAAMVQPYLHQVDEHGETAMVFIDGEFSHAIRKAAILRDGTPERVGMFVVEDIAPRTPSVTELDAGRSALDAVRRLTGGADLLYARVDVVPDDNGSPLVLVVELTEPSLFLTHAPQAASTLAAAISRRLVDRR